MRIAPNVSPSGGELVPVALTTPPPVVYGPEIFGAGNPGTDESGLPLSHYSWLLRTHAVRMLAFVVVVLLATALVTVRLTPIYEATATLYVDRAAQKDVLGKDSDVANMMAMDGDAYLASQIRLLQSDSVVRPLAEQYNLLESEGQIRPGRDGKETTARIRKAPIVLKGLRITRPTSTYILQISYRSPDPNTATDVANGIANSYIEHVYNIRFRSSTSLSRFLSRQQDELRARMEASAARLAALEKELNVLNPDEKTNILSARLLQLNAEYTKVQGQRAQAQSVYNSLASGSLDAALASQQSEELKGVLERLNEERQRFADVKSRYGSNHPEYARLEATTAELSRQVDTSVQLLAKQAAVEFQRARNQEALLKQNVDETKAQYDQLNLRSFEYQRAKQEADADRALNDELVRKIREGQINSGFQNDMVRIADPARPGSKPVYPNVRLNLVLAFFISSLLAVTVVIVADRVDTTIKSPEQVARTLNSRVIGALPILKKGAPRPGVAPQELAGIGGTAGNEFHSTAFDEAIRTVRNSILLTDFDRTLHSILVTSATPAEGKSTVVAHLAMSHAEQHFRTLLIDGDMRRPSIHRLFRLSNKTGLATVIDQNVPWRDLLVQPRPDLELYVLPAGQATRRSFDLVGQKLPILLDDAAKDFNLTFLDAPPLLGFPEPLQMASSVDGVVVVARTGLTDRSAVAAVLENLRQLRANVIGVVLNQMKRENSSSYYYYGENYGKYYTRRDTNQFKDPAA